MLYRTKSTEETMHLGRALAGRLKKGDIICLFGELGAGKTTLVKGIAQGLKIQWREVNSPTFVFLNAYEGRLTLYHFDLYRAQKPQDILALGYEEYLYGEGVSVIEWADKLGPLMPPENVHIELTYKGAKERQVKVLAQGARYRERFKGALIL